MVYEKVSTNMNFVEREKKVEKFWQENDIFKRVSNPGRMLRNIRFTMDRRRLMENPILVTC